MATMRRAGAVTAVLAVVVLAWACEARAAAELKVLLPLGRTACQTNERIELAVVRRAAEALAAGDLALALAGEDGSRLTFTFPVGPVAVAGQEARQTEHVYLDGRLLRPGRYVATITCDGATAKTEIEVYSHIRKTAFRLIDWVPGDAKPPVQQMMGEDGLGFNLFWGGYAPYSENLIRGGLDYMRCCTMSGGHQMDIRQECDWSDPYVLAGGVARVVRQALADRTRPNVIGVHFYDEPGLTWSVDPATGEMTPHTVPAQLRSFESAFGRPRIPYGDVRPDKPDTLAQWQAWGRWHLGFMDASEKLARFGVEYVRPDYLSATQSMYAWYAFGDGYYFNVARSLPVLAGHGGYDEWGPGFIQPPLFLLCGRMRDLDKPAWYMPTWGGQTADRLRMQQYTSFIQNVQGLMVAPPTNVGKPWAEPACDGVAESNILMGRLGTIFTTMPVTRPPVATLWSLSQNLHVQAALMRKPHDEASPGNYGSFQMAQFLVLYQAHVANQTPFFPIVEEDILDGTLAAHHKMVILPKVDYLDPRVVSALEAFIVTGGTVLVSDDSAVAVKGAKKLGVAVPSPKTSPDAVPAFLKECGPVAAALKPHLRKAGIRPAIGSDNPEIVTARQARGDVEYVFAVNAACDVARGGYNPVRPAVATLRLPADGRLVYDAVLGGPAAAFKKSGGELAAKFRFGAGQMRAFARTPRPIGGVQVACPVVVTDFTAAGTPLGVEVTAVVVDVEQRILTGSVPLDILVVDPLGVTRYHLYRATRDGVLRLALPLAVNDPPGEWQVVVRELLAGTEGAAAFTFSPGGQCGAVAGAARRAITFGNDRENVFRFFRVHKDVTIVKGTSAHHAAGAERLAKILAPWGVRCRIVGADEVSKPRAIPEEARRTWVGLEFGRLDPQKPDVGRCGFAIDGPAILLGTPDDNPLIKFLAAQKFLPYAPDKADFPGRGRGLVAWQADAIGTGMQESVTLIAYDEAGLAEAIGSLYEMAAGMDPLMKWDAPAAADVRPAAKRPVKVPAGDVAWRVVLPDRAVAVRPLPKGCAAVLTKDGTLIALDASGKTAWQRTIDGGEAWHLDASDDGSVIAVGASHQLVVMNHLGAVMGAVPFLSGRPGAEGKAVTPVTCVAVSPDGKRVAAGASDGRLMMFESAGGKAVWSTGGATEEEYRKFETDLAQWQAGAAQRDADTKAYREVESKWKTDAEKWEKADANTRGAKPEKPQGPKHPPQPRKPERKPVTFAAFAADGRTLLVRSAEACHIASAETGATIGPVGGLAAMRPVRAGANFLVAAGESVALVSPADGKVLSRVAMPKMTVISAVPAGDGAVVGVAEEGKVVRLGSLAGKDENPALWVGRQPGAMVKKVVCDGGLTAVAYWGGTVRVLDDKAGEVCARRMPQDVADLAWVAGRLVVGLADGTVVAIKVK